MRYKIRVKINGSEYTRYLQENTTIQRAIDETLDVASFTLSFMSERKPFAPYSKVEIIREQQNSLPQVDIMLLESDLVQESSYGTRSYYKHIIKCVEWTQWLSTYSLPDIAITQPITAFVFPLASPTVTEDAFNKEVYNQIKSPFGAWIRVRDELILSETTYSVRSKYIAPLDLRETVKRNFIVKATVASSRSGYTSEVDRGDISYSFYYKNGSSWLPVPPSWSPASGEYEIEARMNAQNYNYLRFKNGGTEIETATAQLDTNQKLKFNIEVASEIDSTDIYTVKEAIEKVIGSYFLEEFGVANKTIKLDSDLVTRLSLDSLKCPEMTLTNGRTMFEALASIGKEFDGIPRLYLDDNGDTVLTYDIVSEPEDNPLYEDDDSLEMEEANMTNYGAGLVGNVSNMTGGEQFKYYPGKDRWVTCRCDPSENALTESNMAIVLNDNIYKIDTVVVKNWHTTEPETEVDIGDYVLEKTVYDSLNNNAAGKGTALYFERGSNKIVGLGALPNTRNLLGLQAGEYVIQKIIKAATSETTVNTEVLDYQYFVRYVPYVDGRIVTVQDNLADTAGAEIVYSNYNQETADISAELYGKTAQKTLQRLGNNDITKETFVYNISQRPALGELKVVDGTNYYANIINEQFQNNRIRLAIQYTKDFNKINNRVGIDKKYREYSLYANNYVNRTININDYCEISYSIGVPNEPTHSTSLSRLCTAFYNAHDPSMYYDQEYPIVAPPYDGFWIIPNKESGVERLTYTPYGESEATEVVPITFIPASYRQLGNAINYIGWCYDNFAAGQYIEKGNEPAFALNNAANRDARYVDDVGECPVLSVILGNAGVYMDDTVTGGRQFPQASKTVGSVDYLWILRRYRINKDNRERIGINYSVHSVSLQKGVHIHSAANKYVFSEDKEALSSLKSLVFIGFKGSIRSKTILNYAQNDILQGEITLERPANSSHFFIKHEPEGVTGTYDGFAVVYAGTGEILYSVEAPVNTNNSSQDRYIRLNFVKQLTN